MQSRPKAKIQVWMLSFLLNIAKFSLVYVPPLSHLQQWQLLFLSPYFRYWWMNGWIMTPIQSGLQFFLIDCGDQHILLLREIFSELIILTMIYKQPPKKDFSGNASPTSQWCFSLLHFFPNELVVGNSSGPARDSGKVVLFTGELQWG